MGKGFFPLIESNNCNNQKLNLKKQNYENYPKKEKTPNKETIQPSNSISVFRKQKNKTLGLHRKS